MKINPYGAIIFFGAFILFILGIWSLIKSDKKDKASKYFYLFIISTTLVIIPALLQDFGVTGQYPLTRLLFIPFQFLSPVFFTAFTCYYLKKETTYKKYRNCLLAPFIIFFSIHLLMKWGDLTGFDMIPSLGIYSLLFREFLAIGFSLALGIWNYILIRNYENSLEKLSFIYVRRKTKWIKGIFTGLILLCVIWLFTIVITLLFIGEEINGHFPYYPLWILFITFYFVFYWSKFKYGRQDSAENTNEENLIRNVVTGFQMSGLHHAFSKKELESVYNNLPEVTGILGYFATSLFDKDKQEEVLWDILENCIAHLQLEDCFVYLLDCENILVQKAAFGSVNINRRKIESPRRIPLGKGIVGHVALSGEYECINDVTKDTRFIKGHINTRSELCVPIFIDNRVIGVLDSEHSQKNFFNESHIFLFRLIAKLTEKKLAQISARTLLCITDDGGYLKALNQMMENEKLFRDFNLGLDNISKRLNISSNYLSQLLNKLNGSNFTDYVNSFRVEDARLKLMNPKFDKYTILAIGMESGFNSKSTFYRAFKKHIGTSPKEYRENFAKNVLIS